MHAQAVTRTPKPSRRRPVPAPHDPAQFLLHAAAGDVTALEGLRKAVGRQNEAFQ
ncbi:hypothetical protein [Streptomyces scabiei]|uniref:hypothetical protein n=1 Tax=Streptomyces scabiei TaxID=1930 RepID=UPI00131EA998|nr:MULTISPECIES: hypothetical protein [Streptomyces]MDX2540199.1 hypothetical protein [Streptomyces scabiei]MDX2862361.1 hypothetical protein [Streptomyces scabiei]MDX3034687.1 hypothetical protein [Streptomyces scabiei]MDX3212169.1 hypothetical protein [Streptomyces scabiei]MDX3279386.1 hypothetical protein [Streptomyces scabiei]